MRIEAYSSAQSKPRFVNPQGQGANQCLSSTPTNGPGVSPAATSVSQGGGGTVPGPSCFAVLLRLGQRSAGEVRPWRAREIPPSLLGSLVVKCVPLPAVRMRLNKATKEPRQSCGKTSPPHPGPLPSDGRGRTIRRCFAVLHGGRRRTVLRIPETCDSDSFSRGEKARMRAGQNTNFRPALMRSFVIPLNRLPGMRADPEPDGECPTRSIVGWQGGRWNCSEASLPGWLAAAGTADRVRV
jgi:hypothetical protein